MSAQPLRIMYLNPVGENGTVDAIFAAMARNHKLPGTEVHVTALPKARYGFSHIEFRTYEALVPRGDLSRNGWPVCVCGTVEPSERNPDS